MKSWGKFSVSVLLFLVMSAASSGLIPISEMPAPRPITGEEPELLQAHSVTAGRVPASSLDEPVGTVYVIGDTWFDLQHNASAGKMIGVDDSGYVHFVWTRGADSGNLTRHVYYNVWNPNTQQMMIDGGTQIDISTRSGFTCQAVLPAGWAFPAFHEIPSGTDPHAAGAMDFIPRNGTFTVTEPSYLNSMQLIWPKIAAGPDNVLHMVTHVNAIPYTVYYSRGIPDFEGSGAIIWQDVAPGQQFLDIGSSQYVSADIAASQVSDRIAIVWTDYRPGGVANAYNQDVFYRVSNDGGETWDDVINLTNFALQDTHRALGDASVVFDYEDNLHLAFTTSYFNEPNGLSSLQKGRIWHWSEADDSINAVADNWVEGSATPGNYRRNVCRPSLSVDTTTGYIFCAYEWYNPESWSTANYYNGDACVSVSTDNGLHWSVGRNVTDTTPDENPSPAGACLSEWEVTLAHPVHYTNGTGHLALEWELDLDAGAGVSTTPEGTVTLNDFYYQRIPVDSIPTTPLMPHFAFRFGEVIPDSGRCCYGDSTDPDCANITLNACMALNGLWDASLFCDTPCPVAIPCFCQDEPYTHCYNTPIGIPDHNSNGISVTIPVPVRYHITDLDVCFELLHPTVGDLTMTLQSPAGTTVTLFMMDNNGPNFRCTVFDDEAAQGIGQGTPPFNDHYRPNSPLTAFDGQFANGDWILHIVDQLPTGVGTLNWMCLTFTYDFIEAAGENELIPVEYSLAAYPNPFNPVTSLRFGIEKAGRVEIQVFDISGRQVRTLADREYAAGYHAVEFDARELPSGIYFAQMRAGEFVKTEKMVLLK